MGQSSWSLEVLKIDRACRLATWLLSAPVPLSVEAFCQILLFCKFLSGLKEGFILAGGAIRYTAFDARVSRNVSQPRSICLPRSAEVLVLNKLDWVRSQGRLVLQCWAHR